MTSTVRAAGVALLLTLAGLIAAACAPAAAPTPTRAPAVATPTPAPAAATATRPPAPAGDTAAGKAAFDRNCNVCHPAGQQGVGPSLVGVGSKMTDDQIRTQVRQGKGAMPAFAAAQISDADLSNLIAYLKTLR